MTQLEWTVSHVQQLRCNMSKWVSVCVGVRGVLDKGLPSKSNLEYVI